MIEIKNLQKEFKQGEGVSQRVLKSINIKIDKGEFLTIMGPSGGGKSTLLYTLGLLSEPTKGEIYYDGQKVNFKKESELDRLRRDRIGFIFQNANLISALNPIENLIVAMSSKESYREKKKKAEELLRKVGLEGKGKSKVSSLSGGEAQRVAIVRALVNNPQVLLCDEPTGALDSENGEMVMKLLMNIRREFGCTLIIVTHDKEIGELGNRRIFLKDGVIHEDNRDAKAI